MATKLNQPIRMCIVCRQRFAQAALVRLQCKGGELVLFTGDGRSFYICTGCVNHKKTPSQIARHCKSRTTETLMNRLKEIAVQ